MKHRGLHTQRATPSTLDPMDGDDFDLEALEQEFANVDITFGSSAQAAMVIVTCTPRAHCAPACCRGIVTI